ncbi:MAG: hypothetical protein P8Y78_15225, partial [Acidihalobacter sp.]
MRLVDAESLTGLVARALMCSNTSESNARCVARALVAADLDAQQSAVVVPLVAREPGVVGRGVLVHVEDRVRVRAELLELLVADDA